MLTFYSVIVLEVVFLMILLVIMANTNDLLSQHKRQVVSTTLFLYYSVHHCRMVGQYDCSL